MKSIIFILFIFSVIYSVFFLHYFDLFTTRVEAGGDISVDFGTRDSGNSLFKIKQMSPGSRAIKEVIVYNDARTNRVIGVKARMSEETGDLSEILMITIIQNKRDVYGGKSGAKTLRQFMQDSANLQGIKLSNIGSGEHTKYTFVVEFPAVAGNIYQGKKLVFDLQIGVILPIPPQCEQIKFSQKPIYGTRKGERLHGTSGNDLIIGFEGNDSIDGKGGDDCILGGEGFDIVAGGGGRDICIGEVRMGCEL